MLKYSEIFSDDYYRFTAESDDERFLQISQHLDRIGVEWHFLKLALVNGTVFCATPCNAKINLVMLEHVNS